MIPRSAIVLMIAAAAFAAVFAFRGSAPVSSLPEFKAFTMTPEVVERAFTGSGQPIAGVRAVLVNHHLLAPDLIADALSRAATDEPVTVVLIAPDHFGRGAAPVSSVIARWPTPFGTLGPDSDAISRLASGGHMHLQELPFKGEHGITNITPFIARVLPNARLVPIIVKTHAPIARIMALATEISRLPEPILVVGSFDFTHDATHDEARINDERTLAILEGGDPSGAEDVVVDSVGGIRLLMEYARLAGLRFAVLAVSDSAQVLGDLGRTDVTSYITGYWVK